MITDLSRKHDILCDTSETFDRGGFENGAYSICRERTHCRDFYNEDENWFGALDGQDWKTCKFYVRTFGAGGAPFSIKIETMWRKKF